MKKTAIILTGLIAVLVNVSAIYCPECDFGDGEYRIMRTSEPSIPGVVSESVEEVGKGCRQGEPEVLENVSTEVINGTYHLTFTGNMAAPNPCQKFGYNLERNGSTYVLETAYRQENGTCTQCTGNIEYSADIEFNQSFTLQVVHQGERKAALVGNENGTANYLISRGSSASEEVAENPEPLNREFQIQDGNIKVERQNASCHDSSGSGITSESVVTEKQNGETTGYDLRLEGYVETANPCSLLNATTRTEGETVILQLEEESSGMNCVQCTGKVGFKVTGELGKDFSLEVRKGQTVLKKITRSSERRNVFGRFIDFLLSFF